MAHESTSPTTAPEEITTVNDSTLTSEDADDIRDAELEAEAAEARKHDLAARYVGRESWSTGLNTVAIFMAGAFFALYVPATTLSNEHGWLAWAFLGSMLATFTAMVGSQIASPNRAQREAYNTVERERERAKVEAEIAWRVELGVELEVGRREHERVMAALEESSRKSREEHERFMADLRQRRGEDAEEADRTEYVTFGAVEPVRVEEVDAR